MARPDFAELDSFLGKHNSVDPGTTFLFEKMKS